MSKSRAPGARVLRLDADRARQLASELLELAELAELAEHAEHP